MNVVSIRGEWVGKRIDGKFPLLAWLGGSGATGVFLTEVSNGSQATGDVSSAPAPIRAAIKLIVASPKSEDRLAMWNLAATLSHPHVARIFQTGHATIEETKVVYIVSELAEEILGQIIPERPLTQDETRDMLFPILDALACLHGREYVHAHLKPSNILVIDNEIKLSSDGFVIAGSHGGEEFTSELHNAPEIHSSPVTTAADIWSLGVTLVESLTRQLPIWDAATDAEVEVPDTLPSPFAEIVRECLRVDPSHRCMLNEVREMLDSAPESTAAREPVVAPKPPIAENAAVLRAPALQAEDLSDVPAEHAEGRKIPVVPLIVGFVLLVAIILGFAMRSRKTDTAPSPPDSSQQAPPAEPVSPNSTPPAQADATVSAEVLDRVMPDVSRGASNTIHGKVSVAVRINVDETGAVSKAEFASHGPSAYFARVALESAQKWKFKPAQKDGKATPSTWMLRYEFRRDGTEVKPTPVEP
jgi:eukaryotic-like serine/threonine-protein kinase